MTQTPDVAVDHEAGLVDRSVFFDEDVYRRELQQIFARCWLFLAHESQLARPGDFFATYMGEDPVLVVRQRDGSIKAMLNSCRHRGMRVCRADLGNTKAFTCTYHGWSYDPAGRLVTVPLEEEVYGNRLDKDRWGLVEVAQLDSYGGLVFATWDPDAPPLPDYLGDMRHHLDFLVDRAPGGSEVVGGVHKWVISGNWKLAAEQFAGDNYHAPISHSSALTALMSDLAPEKAAMMMSRMTQGYQFSSRLGHGAGFWHAPEHAPHDSVIAGQAVEDWWTDTVIPHARARLADAEAPGWLGGHNTVFPTFSWLTGVSTIRVWHPKGPNAMEVWAWVLVDRDAPPEVKDQIRLNAIRTFSPSGLLEQDDGENWSEITKIFRGEIQRRYPFNYQMALGSETDGAGPFPGRTGSVMNEMAARGFYRRYRELMAGAPWSEIPPAKEDDR